VIAVVGPFAEAVRATFQPCTFLLIVPIMAAVVAARARWQALVAAAVAAVVGGWIVADNSFLLDGWLLRLSAVVVIALLLLLVAPQLAERIPSFGAVPSSSSAQAAAVGAITLIATQWWRPCVGEELGVILNGAQDGLGGQLLPMAAYMLGALVPVALVVAIRYAVDPAEPVLATATWVAAAVAVVVAGSLVAGQHDDVVVTLTRWTLE